MKKIEKPFGMTAYAKVEAALAAYEIGCKRVKDLKFLREQISKGLMGDKFYDFLNMDGSLENLLQGLPRPSAGVSCESLKVSQLALMDATIADESVKLGELFQALWQAIKEWFMDWWDRNRWEQKHLRTLLAQFRQSAPTYFGDDASFTSTIVYMYRHNDWYQMVEACRKLNDECRELPADAAHLKEWIESTRTAIPSALAEFGKYINEAGFIKQGQPKYVRQQDACGNLRWRFNEIGTYLNDAIELLGDEIAIRRQFNALEHLFLSSGEANRADVLFIRQVIFNSKENSLAVGRTLKLMLHRVIRARMTEYRVGSGDRQN